MAEFRLSKTAAADVGDIADYTISHFGIEQARRYRDGLVECFSQLAETPLLGRNAGELSPGLRRFEHQSHVVFYQLDPKGVLIVRVLHRRMDAPTHLGES